MQRYARKPLISANAATITTGGSSDFGAFPVAGYSRFTGMYSTVGSLTLRIQTGVASGNYQISSVTAINSGFGIIDALNYGQVAAFDITAAQSTIYNLLLSGEPMR